MDKLLYVLIVEDSPDDAELLILELKKNGFQVSWERVDSKVDFESCLKIAKWDIIISDYVMNGFTGLDALRILKKANQETPFIIVSGSIGEELAVEAMREGAQDYIMKDKIMRLGPAVKRELRDAKTRKDHQQAIDSLRISEQEWRFTFNAISDSVSIIDLEGKILNTNKSTLKYFELAFENIIGMKFEKLLPKLSVNDAASKILSSLVSQKRTLRTISHSCHWFTVSFDPIIENEKVKGGVMVLKDITKERTAARKLENSQQKLESILVSAPVGIGIVKDQEFVFVNDRLCMMLGYKQDEIQGKSVSLILVPDLEKNQGIEFDQGQNFDFYSTETQYLCENGNHLQVVVSSTWLDPSNKSKGITFTIQDISTIKLAEQDLRESEERFRALSNATNEAVFISKKGICIETNKAATDMFGYSYTELIGIFGTDVIAPESKEFVKQNMLSGYSEPYEAIGLRKDGSKFYGEFLGKMFKFRGQNVRITTVRDLTKRKKAELALTKSLHEYQALSDNLPLGIYRSSMDGKIIACNPAFVSIFGFEKEELLKSVSSNDLYKNISDRHKFLELIEKGNKVKSYQTELLRKDGSSFWASINAQIMFDETNNPEFIDGIIEDITERRKIQTEIEKSREKAEESDRLKSAFLANMSHEIRTPMNAILGFSELLGEPDITPNEQQEYIDLIRSNGTILLRIIGDIMDFARIEARELKMQFELCNIDVCLKSVIANTQSTIQKKEKDLNIIFKPPDQFKAPQLATDPERFKQIFTNLMDNAEKFTRSGEIVCGYSLEKDSKHNNHLKFYVHDTGIGIPNDKLEVIFDRFRQVDDSHTRLFGGTGLGLSITKKLVEALDGEIWVESEIGVGTVFFVRLPFKQKIETPTQDAEKPTEQDGVYDWSKNLILVVEDVPSNYLYLEKLLKFTKARLVWAQDGKMAIEKFDENPNFDLVIMDINLPEINGMDVTRYIRSKNSEIPVIAQTAYARETDKQDCLDAGCNDFITKPIKKKVFFDVLANYMPIKK
ncbi:MAG: PAS domain S-box protein [Bacteroidales bacterium]|nr:PAS domain S-box protein [Bacteroidales bacterium]MCF8458938.1 PAS domain S-box protein [Bacteroidales bacterium]